MERYLKNKKIKMRFSEDIEPHEVFLDSLAQKREKEIGVSEKKLEVPLARKIFQGFLISVLILIFILFLKTFQLQIIEGKDFLAKARENKFIVHSIRAERGVIYDRNLEQLVFNKPSFDLILDKKNLPPAGSEKDKILKEISLITQKNLGELEKEIEESEKNQILISENLSHETLIILETKIRELPGFKIENNPAREYQEGEIFSHILGYTNKIRSEELKEAPQFYSIFDYVGRDGIEKSYEELLRKNPGKLQVERDALGNVISKEIISFPESGKSLVLWLDSDLQKKVKEELEKGTEAVGSRKGAAVALDPNTGGVLALISLPSFDNNLFQKGADIEALKKLLGNPQEPLFNRAISGTYLTGSTIKPLIASAVLEEKIIKPDKKIDCQGSITIPHQYDPEKETKKSDWTVHGLTDLRKAIAESCNVYFYTVGGGYEKQQGLGPTKIKKYLELFGWNAKTGIDLPGEIEGFIPDREWKKKKWNEGWWDGDTYNLSIGQGFLQITPLEVAAAFSAIANGGRLFQPQVVQKIVDSEKNLIEEIQPQIIRENFINPENLKIVQEGMRQAVSGQNSPQASSVILNSLPVKVAAKTGTAELGRDFYHNWITVFAPYENPQIVLTVMIENVKGVKAAALPVAKSILEWYFTPK